MVTIGVVPFTITLAVLMIIPFVLITYFGTPTLQPGTRVGVCDRST